MIVKYKNYDMYRIGHNTIINADILDESLFDKPFIDVIVTSPPYNLDINYASNNDSMPYKDYLEFTRKWLSNCFKWSKKNARLALNIPLDKNKFGHQSVGADITTIAKSVGWQYFTTIVWNEGNISRRTAWGSYMSASAPYIISPVELIVVFFKDGWKKTMGSKRSTISKEEFLAWTNGLWSFNGESKKKIGHPAPFPRELPKRCIKMFSYEKDVIFDPFLGSGTTLIEAKVLNRIGVGVEIDRSYCELAVKRILETKE